MSDDELDYVISKSGSIENLYWHNSQESWGPIETATRYTRRALNEMPEARHDGFWTTYERAVELETCA